VKLPVQVTFRQVDESESLKRLILNESENLNRFFPRIMGCRVLVEKPHRHHHKGSPYHVRVQLAIPGHDIIAGGDTKQIPSYSNPYVAIRNTFRDARRRLQHEVHLLRHETKHHTHAAPEFVTGS